MSLPTSQTWDLVDWVTTSIVDVATGMAAQIGGRAFASRADHVLLDDKAVYMYSDDGLVTNYVLSLSMPVSFTIYLEGVLVPPSGVVDGDNLFALGAEDRHGVGLVVYLDAAKTRMFVQYGSSLTPVSLGSAGQAIAEGSQVALRLVVNGETRLMDVYATPIADIPVSGEVLRGTVPILESVSLQDVLGIYLKGTSGNTSALHLFSFGASSKLLYPRQRPVALTSGDQVVGVPANVTVSGLSSYDLGKSALTYAWRVVTQPEGSNIVLSGMRRASGRIGDLLFSSALSGEAGNGDVVRVEAGGSRLGLSVENLGNGRKVVIIRPVVVGGIVKTTNRDVVLALSDPRNDAYSAAAASVVSVEIAAGGNEWNPLLAGAEVMLAGGVDSSFPVVTFTASRQGLYELGLVVTNEFGISSTETIVSIRAEGVSTALGHVPDASFIWNYLSDAWKMVAGREAVNVFWSALLQKVTDELLQIVQAQDEMTFKGFPSQLLRRWVSFAVREALPESVVTSVTPAVSDVVLYDDGDGDLSTTLLRPDGDMPALSVGDRMTWSHDSVASGRVLTVVRAFEYVFESDAIIPASVNRLKRDGDGVVFRIVRLCEFGVADTKKFVVLFPETHVLERYDRLRDSAGNLYVVVGKTAERVYAVNDDIPFFSPIDSGTGLRAVDRNTYPTLEEPNDKTDEVVANGTFDFPLDGDLYLHANGVVVGIDKKYSTAHSLRIVPSLAFRARRAWVATPWGVSGDGNGMTLSARAPGSAGNGICLVTKLGPSPAVRVIPRTRTIEVTVREVGATFIWEIYRLMTDATYPGFCAEADRLVEVAVRDPYERVTHLPDEVLELTGGVESGPYDWSILKKPASVSVRVGPVVEFGEPLDDDDPVILVGDLLETEVSGTPVGWPEVVAVSASEAIVDSAIPSGGVVASVVHSRRYRPTVSGLRSVPRLQSVIKNPADNQLFLSGNHYIVHDDYVEFLSKPAFLEEPENAPDRLWAEAVFVDNTKTLESNFGVMVGLPREAFTEAGLDISYLSAVKGLFFIAYHGPAFANIRIGAQIFANLAFAEEPGVIEDIQDRFDLEHGLGRILIRSSDGSNRVRTYYYPSSKGVEINPDTGKPLAVGDSVGLFQPLCKGVRTGDYLSDPIWDSGPYHEITKYHIFYVFLDGDVASPQSIMLASRVVKAIKPAYTDVVFGIRHAPVSQIEVTDSLTWTNTLRLSDDRYTVEEENPPFKSGYEHRVDHVDGAGSTYGDGIERIHTFDTRVGSGSLLPENILAPDGVLDKMIDREPRMFDFVSAIDDRQKCYFDRINRYGPEDIPDALVCTYFPENGGAPLARKVNHAFNSTAFMSGNILVDNTKNFLVFGITLGTMVTFPDRGEVGWVIGVAEHELTLFGTPLYGRSVEYVVHKYEPLDRVCDVEDAGDGFYRLYDAGVLFPHCTDVKVGYFVYLNPGGGPGLPESGEIVGVEDGVLTVFSAGGMTEAEDVPYRCLPPIVGPKERIGDGLVALEHLIAAGVGPGMYPRCDTIFRFDMTKRGEKKNIEGRFVGPPEALSYIEQSEPNFDHGFYCWFDGRVTDPDGALPDTDRGGHPWRLREESNIVSVKFGCTVSRLGSSETPSERNVKYPLPLLIDYE